jgi:1-aminocyclopropane-1-carboxylate deaminase/D-cysteine desulfhydrase-like pyridoxal-dependent ACC family enzyme
VQSNHTRQVATVAARLGMKCVLVQEDWVNWYDGAYDRVGNILLSRILGADVRLVHEGFGMDIVLDTRYAHPEYGIPSAETLDAIRTCARCEGMLTDPVYEGKSTQGMMDLIRREEIPPGARVLYAHLGGVPAIDGYGYLFRNG